MRYSEDLKDILIVSAYIVFGILVIVLGLVAFKNIFGPTKEQQAQMHKTQLISEIDGCKVYRFYDGNYHYVTRCGGNVTTQKNWSESCGKACTKRKTEELITEGNQ